MQSNTITGHKWTPFGTRLVAYSNYAGELPAGTDYIEHALSLLVRNIDANLFHDLDRKGIELARFQSGTLSLKLVRTDLIEKCLRHLASCAIVNADE